MFDISHLDAALTEVAADHGMELVDLEFCSERSGWVLRLFVDRLDGSGVTVEDCARVSRDCSVTLDAEDLIDRRYRLEVSSPGVERRLRKPEHFERQLGQKVHVVLRVPVGGRRRVTGELIQVGEDTIRLMCPDGAEFEVPFEKIKRANLKVF
jgi:ribosome maturation factor RimP